MYGELQFLIGLLVQRTY